MIFDFLKSKSKANAADSAEFEQVVGPLLDDLYRMAYSLTRNKADAEDLVQETSIKAFRNFQKFERGTKIKAWLFTILRNTFFNEYRRKKRAPETSIDAEPEFSFYWQFRQGMNQNQSAPLPDLSDPSKLEYVLGDEVTKALEDLPPDFREVIFLCDVQEFSYEEISKILNIPIGTVRSRIARARSQMQKQLWDYVQTKGLRRS